MLFWEQLRSNYEKGHYVEGSVYFIYILVS